MRATRSHSAAHDRVADLDFEHLAGGVLSALPPQRSRTTRTATPSARTARRSRTRGAIPRAGPRDRAHRTPVNRPAEECGSHEASAGARGDVPSRRDFSIRLAAGRCEASRRLPSWRHTRGARIRRTWPRWCSASVSIIRASSLSRSRGGGRRRRALRRGAGICGAGGHDASALAKTAVVLRGVSFVAARRTCWR